MCPVINRLDYHYGNARNLGVPHDVAEEYARLRCDAELNPRLLPAIILDVTIRPAAVGIWQPKDSGHDDEYWRLVYEWWYIPDPTAWTGTGRAS